MKSKPNDLNNFTKEVYDPPVISVVYVTLESCIAASSVSTTGIQQEHNDETQSFEMEW